MPTIFTLFGYRFQFYSNDHTPIHVHVVKGGAKAKFNLFPVELVSNQGFKPTELKMIEAIIEENEETARRMGISQSLMAQYISGKKKASDTRMALILNTIHAVGRELTEV